MTPSLHITLSQHYVVNGVAHDVVLHNVLYATSAIYNLNAASKVQRKNFWVVVVADNGNNQKGKMEFVYKTFSEAGRDGNNGKVTSGCDET